MCKNMHICHYCANFILVGDVNTEMKSLLDTLFPLGSESLDEVVWRKQYKELASRVLAMEHLGPPLSTVKRITGREKRVVGGFTEGVLYNSNSTDKNPLLMLQTMSIYNLYI